MFQWRTSTNIFSFFISDILNELFQRENRVLHYWTMRKRRLDQCQQYVVFERSAKQVSAYRAPHALLPCSHRSAQQLVFLPSSHRVSAQQLMLHLCSHRSGQQTSAPPMLTQECSAVSAHTIKTQACSPSSAHRRKPE